MVSGRIADQNSDLVFDVGVDIHTTQGIVGSDDGSEGEGERLGEGEGERLESNQI